MSRFALRRRLENLAARIRPHDSLAARVSRLPAHLQVAYLDFRDQVSQWHDEHEGPAAAYAAMIGDDNSYPRLRADVAEALWGVPATIPAGATVEDAQRAYADMKDQR